MLFASKKDKMVTKARILAIFNDLDVDKSGSLSYLEMKRLFVKLNIPDV